MKLKTSLAVALAATLVAGATAQAQTAAPPVLASNYITFGGLDWAWASPCQLGGGGCGGTFVLADGFRFATQQEWNARPDATNFLDANAPGGFRCASAWFNISPAYTHCDYTDALGGYVSSGPSIMDVNRPVPPNGNDETWLVRGQVNAVPEPGTVALVGAGLAGLLALGRRRNKR